MTSLKDIRIMNEALIEYYIENDPNNEEMILKHRIIKEVLKSEDCFNKIDKEEAIKILRDLGIFEEKLELTYQQIINKKDLN